MKAIKFEGIGFPSSSQQVQKASYGPYDPNGYYLIYNLDPQCNFNKIKNKYYELSKKYHPDGKNPNIDKFREIQQIYEVLSDHSKRKQYNSISDDSNNIFIDILEKEKLFKIASERKIPWHTLVTGIADIDKTNNGLTEPFYTFLADGPERCATAQGWYRKLLCVAYLYRWEAVVRVAVCPLDVPYKITKLSNYVIFWFHSDLEPEWLFAYSAFRMV